MNIDPTASKVAEIDARISRIEGILEQVVAVQREHAQAIRDLSNRMSTGFYWIVGIQFTTLLTLGTLILFKLG